MTEMPPPDDQFAPSDDRIIGVAFRWSLAVFAVIAVVVVATVALLRRPATEQEVIERPPVVAPDALPTRAPEMPRIPFTDVAAAAGVDFVHEDGARGEKLLPESMGGGVAFFDCDGDGDQDLLLVDSGTGLAGAGDVTRAPLYVNDGAGRFTHASDLEYASYGMGVAIGDYDGDGDRDVYLTTVGVNHLFRNDGDRFVDVTAAAGVAGPPDAWSTSAGFFDGDGDGDLDLFVANYVEWSREFDLDLGFTLNGTDRAYGPPRQYPGAHCMLFRNDGDGRFTDVSAESGIEIANPATGAPMAKVLGVTFVDVDGRDGLDVLVANDTVQNFLFRGRGDGTFEEIGALAGVAFDNMGAATGAMGIDAADFGADGRIGIAIGNFANESTSFYVQQDPLQFADMASAEGIGSASRLHLSFGVFLFDADLDGHLDMVQANGHLENEINEIQPSQHYEQAGQLFWNAGPDARLRFAALPDAHVGDLARPIVGRGAAYADIDGDGDLDVVLTQVGGPPLVLRNDQTLGHHWVRVRLRDDGPNPDAIGATVEVKAGGRTQRQRVMPTRSYLSQVELPVTFGLGDAGRVDEVRVTWPDGSVTVHRDVPIDVMTTIARGGGA